MRLGFEHTYGALPPRFFMRVAPTPVANPRLVIFNERLAQELGLEVEAVEREGALLFSGNQLPEDADPIAMAYAGDQFGNFVPRLGDGRAILLGELKARDGTLRDIQLKGAGLTPFSRNADGRAALGPMLREYLISEAMYALGIPTTQSLAVVTTGEQVLREDVLPGAILTRVAASHVRVGTFQYFAARDDQEGVRALLDYVIARHYPAARDAASPALEVLSTVAERQARLVARWMLVGFIHGVMNTDNMAISGETIDYGPCAFMDEYDPQTVFSSIDRRGRYAYVNQAAIAQWNLARFADALVSLIDANLDKAVARASEVVQGFMARFDAHLLQGFRSKIGLTTTAAGDADLIRRVLGAMHEARADFTLTFRRLARAAERSDEDAQLFVQTPAMLAWLQEWRERLAREPQGAAERAANMRRVNPAFIPRNHRVDAALTAASDGEDFEPFRRLLAVLQRPFDDQPEASEYERPPDPSERVLHTFCGT
jgi:uncharacterized protein YdiU (UPF0061 family)